MEYLPGACQADGSEYHGRYVDHMTREQLIDWHRPRVARLLDCGVDLLAFETIPSQVRIIYCYYGYYAVRINLFTTADCSPLSGVGRGGSRGWSPPIFLGY